MNKIFKMKKRYFNTKQRLFEMTEKVNKIKINENLTQTVNLLDYAIKNLIAGALQPEKGGSNNTILQSEEGESFITIDGSDMNNNNYHFRFKILGEDEGDASYTVTDVNLIEFSFTKENENLNVELAENSPELDDFNKEHGAELYDALEEYIGDSVGMKKDLNNKEKSEEPTNDEKNIDSLKETEDPLNNLDIKQKSQELGQIDTTISNWYNKTNKDEKGEFTNDDKYSDIFPQNKNMKESIDTDKYESVVFLQGEEAAEPLRILNDEGEDAAIEYLKQWHQPGSHEGNEKIGAGTEDNVYEKDGYVLVWNDRLGYIGLEYDLSYLDEEIDNINDNVNYVVVDDDFNRQWYKDIIGKVYDTPPPFAHVKEVDKKDIQSEIALPDENGEYLEGGLADGHKPDEYDPAELGKGVQVEMEHTDDPKVALEIAMDHLQEIPDYYTRLDQMEKDAGVEDDDTPKKHVDLPIGGINKDDKQLIVDDPDLQEYAEYLNNEKELEDEILGVKQGMTPNTQNEGVDLFGENKQLEILSKILNNDNQNLNEDSNEVSDEDSDELENAIQSDITSDAVKRLFKKMIPDHFKWYCKYEMIEDSEEKNVGVDGEYLYYYYSYKVTYNNISGVVRFKVDVIIDKKYFGDGFTFNIETHINDRDFDLEKIEYIK